MWPTSGRAAACLEQPFIFQSRAIVAVSVLRAISAFLDTLSCPSRTARVIQPVCQACIRALSSWASGGPCHRRLRPLAATALRFDAGDLHIADHAGHSQLAACALPGAWILVEAGHQVRGGAQCQAGWHSTLPLVCGSASAAHSMLVLCMQEGSHHADRHSPS